MKKPAITAPDHEGGVPAETEAALQTSVALIELGKILAPHSRRERLACRRRLLSAARRSPPDQWLVRGILTELAHAIR
jgi:hypothetical protein